MSVGQRNRSAGEPFWLGWTTGPESLDSPIHAEALQEAVISLSRAVFSRGGTLLLTNSDPLVLLVLVVATEYWERDVESERLLRPSEPSVYMCGPTEDDDFAWWTGTGLLVLGGRDWLPDDTMPRLVETQNPLAMICLGGVGRVAIQAHLFREYGRGRPIFAIASTGGDARALADHGVAIAEDRNLMLELGPLRENADLSEEREPLGGAPQRDEAAIVPFSLLMQRLVDRLAPPQ